MESGGAWWEGRLGCWNLLSAVVIEIVNITAAAIMATESMVMEVNSTGVSDPVKDFRLGGSPGVGAVGISEEVLVSSEEQGSSLNRIAD